MNNLVVDALIRWSSLSMREDSTIQNGSNFNSDWTYPIFGVVNTAPGPVAMTKFANMLVQTAARSYHDARFEMIWFWNAFGAQSNKAAVLESTIAPSHS